MYTDGPGARDLVRRPELNDLIEVHDGDAVGDVAYDIQIMGDKKIGEPEARGQVLHQVGNCARDGYLEAGRRLVGEDQVGS